MYLKATDGTTSGRGNIGSVTFKGSKDAILNIEITETSKNTGKTINAINNLNFLSGTVNSRGQFMVDGIVTISGGNLNIDTENMTYGSANNPVRGIYALKQVKITGGNVNIKSNSSAIRVVGVSGSVEPEDGVIISGGNISLSSQRPNDSAIFAGDYQNKNIIIDGGNITLGGEYGIYTYNGVIKVNHFDSLNTDNVKKEVFKVRVSEGNKIIYAEADYSKVDEAINEANNLNKDDYVDFSAVEEAISAVVRNKNILEQDEVDAMEKAIYDAINSLQLKEKIDEINETDKADELDDTPKTGIENETNIAVIVAISALTGIVILRKKQ